MDRADNEPPPCPWCGQDRIREMDSDLNGNRWFRCEACLETFHIRTVKLPTPNGKDPK
jgi:transposase-like protein